MGDKSKIEWTDATWNPVRGCSRVSEGCRNCYAEEIASRFSGPGLAYDGLATRRGGEARWTGAVFVIEEHLRDPIRWRRPRRIFVNSMSDLFHERLSEADIGRVFNVMAQAPQHTFQVLTKRAKRMREIMPRLLEPWANVPFDHVWFGVSAENQETADERIPELLATPAAVRFVSAEPLLGPIQFGVFQGDECEFFDYGVGGGAGLDWVIVGGESGPHARPMHIDWARGIRDQCVAAGVSFFFKQWGEFAPQNVRDNPVYLSGDEVVMVRDGKKRAGRELDNRTWDEFPIVRT